MNTRFFRFVFQRISYTFFIALSGVVGGWFAALYGYYFIYGSLGSDHLKGREMEYLINSLLGGAGVATLLHYLHYGLLHPFGFSGFQKNIKIINRNFTPETLRQKSKNDLLELLNALIWLPKNSLMVTFFYCTMVVLLAVFLNLYVADNILNTAVILGGGIIADFVYCGFAYIITEYLTRETRVVIKNTLDEKGVPYTDSSILSLRIKFTYLLLLGTLSMIILAVIVGRGQISNTGSIMFISVTVLANVMLISFYLNSINVALSQLNVAAADLAKGGPGKISPISVDNEIVFFSKNFKSAAQEVTRIRSNLEELVEERTVELKKTSGNLERAKKETDEIMRSVEEGLFLLYKEGDSICFRSQYSQELENIFMQRDLGGKNFADIIESMLPDKLQDKTRKYIKMMFRKDRDDHFLNQLNPLREIEVNLPLKDGGVRTKNLQFKFRRIRERKKILHLLGVARDVSEQVQLAKQVEEVQQKSSRQMQTLFSLLHVEPVLMTDFLNGAEAELVKVSSLIKGCSETQRYSELLPGIYRSIHTVKGNAGLLDLKFFAERAHEFESKISELQSKEKLRGADFLPLTLQVTSLRQELNEVREQMDKLAGYHSSVGHKKLNHQKWLLDSLEKLIDRISQEKGKKASLQHSGFGKNLFSEKYATILRDILVQLCRNSIVHGIETPDERKASDKEPAGVIEIKIEPNNGMLQLKYRDDGRGIDLERVRSTALATGKWEREYLDALDDEKTARLILEPGFSTTKEADLDSGRGVGMDIVEQSIRDVSGSLEIEFSPGKFTEFVILLPVEKME